MKLWAVLTVLLYALALLALTLPVDLLAFGNWARDGSQHGFQDILRNFYLNWGYWLWLAVLVAGQALLLLLPLRIADRRLPARRPLKIPVLVTAFFLANLLLAAAVSMLCALFRDDGLVIFTFADRLANLFRQTPGPQTTSGGGFISFLFLLACFWIFGRSFFVAPPARTTRPPSSSAASAGCCAAASLNCSSPCPAMFSSGAATTAARRRARSGASPPAFP